MQLVKMSVSGMFSSVADSQARINTAMKYFKKHGFSVDDVSNNPVQVEVDNGVESQNDQIATGEGMPENQM